MIRYASIFINIFLFPPRMPEFLSEIQDYYRSLEGAIEGMLCEPSIPFLYQADGRSTKTPVYLLPIEWKDSKPLGQFSIENTLTLSPFGFSFTLESHAREYFSLTKELTLAKVPSANVSSPYDALYLPLVLTHVQTHLGHTTDGVFTHHSGSPFEVYGVRGDHLEVTWPVAARGRVR